MISEMEMELGYGDYNDIPSDGRLYNDHLLNDRLVFKCPRCNTVFKGMKMLLRGECRYCLLDWEPLMHIGEDHEDESEMAS